MFLGCFRSVYVWISIQNFLWKDFVVCSREEVFLSDLFTWKFLRLWRCVKKTNTKAQKSSSNRTAAHQDICERVVRATSEQEKSFNFCLLYFSGVILRTNNEGKFFIFFLVFFLGIFLLGNNFPFVYFDRSPPQCNLSLSSPSFKKVHRGSIEFLTL